VAKPSTPCRTAADNKIVLERNGGVLSDLIGGASLVLVPQYKLFKELEKLEEAEVVGLFLEMEGSRQFFQRLCRHEGTASVERCLACEADAVGTLWTRFPSTAEF
jgi:hypothetical protein